MGDNLKSLKKEELLAKVEHLLSENENLKSNKSSIAPPTTSVSDNFVSEQILSLLEENKKLKEELKSGKREVFVGVRNNTLSNVWLPAPESFSGSGDDANKGVLISGGEIKAVPSYYVTYYASREDINVFSSGDLIVDNESARRGLPHMIFVDDGVPELWLKPSFDIREVRRLCDTNIDEFKKVVDANYGNSLALNKLKIVADEKSIEFFNKDDSDPRVAKLEYIVTHINSVLGSK